MKSINLTIRFIIFADLDFVELKRLAEILWGEAVFFFLDLELIEFYQTSSKSMYFLLNFVAPLFLAFSFTKQRNTSCCTNMQGYISVFVYRRPIKISSETWLNSLLLGVCGASCLIVLKLNLVHVPTRAPYQSRS